MMSRGQQRILAYRIHTNTSSTPTVWIHTVAICGRRAVLCTPYLSIGATVCECLKYEFDYVFRVLIINAQPTIGS